MGVMIQRIYRYHDGRYKVTKMVPNAPKMLIEEPDSNDLVLAVEKPFEKLRNNVVRAAGQIQSLGLCNDWDWFATFTLDKKNYPDRLALDSFRHDLTQFIRDLRKRYPGYACAFLLVPELHQDAKGWHMHGLLRDFPADLLRLFTLKEKLPYYIRNKLQDGLPVYDFPEYRKKFGFCDIEPLRERDAAVGYLTKYVIKGLNATGKHLEKGKHLFFVSRGLQRPQLVEEKEVESIPGPAKTEMLSDLELDGLIPCFQQVIKAEVDGVERIFGEFCWYELAPFGIIPSEIT